MRKNLLFILAVAYAYTASAQEDSSLSAFRYRIDNYKAVNLNANSGTQYNKQELGIGNVQNSYSSSGFGVTIYTVKSTDNLLRTISGSLGTAFNSSKNKNPVSTNRSRLFSAAAQFNLANKWFKENRFTELSTEMAAEHISSKSKENNLPPSLLNTQTGYAMAVTAGIGKGRLENITDMQNALWLNQALQQNDRLSRSLSASELNNLGRAITKANNTRILDFRKRTQFVLETVDNYMQQAGLISKTDITYFSNLNDILFFAFNNPRLSGTEKFIRLTPAISGRSQEVIQNDRIEKYQQDPFIKSAILSTGFNTHKPISLKRQHNYGASLRLSYTDYHSTEKFFNTGVLISEIELNNTIKQAGVNIFYQHAVYPSTRTNINFTLQSEAGYQDTDAESGFYGSASLAAALNYFISYRTRFTCDINTGYRKNIYTAYQNLEPLPDNLQLSVNAGIAISL